MKKKVLKIQNNLSIILTEILKLKAELKDTSKWLKDILSENYSPDDGNAKWISTYKKNIDKITKDLSKIMPCDLDGYYYIFGASGWEHPIGKTTGEGIIDTVIEEPRAGFQRINKKEYNKEMD